MTDFLKNISLFKKLLILSFFITFMIVAITSAFSYYLQSKQMDKLLSEHAMDVAVLWGTTIESDDVETVLKTKNEGHVDFIKLKRSLSNFTNKNNLYLNSFIVDSKLTKKDEVFIITSDEKQKKNGWLSLSSYKANEKWMEGYQKAVQSNMTAHSKVYQDDTGTWITAFSPIMNEEGKMIALFGVDINADSIIAAQKKYAFFLIALFLLMTPLIFFILKKGFNKALEPVHELMKGFNEVSNGNFDVNLKVTDNSDLGLLCDRFNFMVKQLSILVEKLPASSDKKGSADQQNALHNLEEVFDEVESIIESSKLIRELQRAEKMNAIGQLAASVAHEIRNPMTVVKGFLQIFLAKEQMSEEERMYIRLMIDEMDRAETIINDYLSLAKPDMEQTESIAGKELAEKVMDLMNSYAMMSKNIIMMTPMLENITVRGIKNELQQVLINMLKNSIEAMKDGGELRLSLYREGQFGVFEITDTGIGMTEEEMKRLGTAFYSLKEKGTGMGLTVCYQIIERMKGRIEVESEKGVGTTFKIYVPTCEE
ncbi:ATP-binding protein [Niallia endozanthoxylica]|uniref:histidine kinase n=1 Tax=Niallia endozanthoxylica TaxID=2036016 RepID=A0A5J5HLT4_9BACI|nr:ATP-binding protein [Niallia endozanthoxylica]KAA9021695.1 two-component sensor histidine kinase [Niallia endozanthoxylica]